MCSTSKLRIEKFTGPKTAPFRSERTVLPGQRRADCLSGQALPSKATLQVMSGAEDRPARSERTVLPGQRRADCLSGEALPSKATVLVMKSALIDLEIRPVLRIRSRLCRCRRYDIRPFFKPDLTCLGQTHRNGASQRRRQRPIQDGRGQFTRGWQADLAQSQAESNPERQNSVLAFRDYNGLKADPLQAFRSNGRRDQERRSDGRALPHLPVLR